MLQDYKIISNVEMEGRKVSFNAQKKGTHTLLSKEEPFIYNV